MDAPSVWTLKDIVTVSAIVIGPVVAVIITLAWQNRKEKRDAKIRVFSTLMAYRKSLTGIIKQEYVNSLNLIDVVFSDSPKVVGLWHEYFALLQRYKPSPQELEGQSHKYIELMTAMAEELGFANLQQIDMEKFYTPIAHGLEAESNAALRAELLRVLENTERFVVVSKKSEPKQIEA